MDSTSPRHPADALPGRLTRIAQARQAWMHEGRSLATGWVEPWVEQSWRRCLSLGLSPTTPVSFEPVTRAALQQTRDANQRLIDAAQPILQGLTRAIVHTRYFAILTNARGVVVDVNGLIDRSDRRADLITRIGVDLSEPAMGTTAISTALIEQQPVWLHRGEHFFADTSVYSCAGAPILGPDGRCVGMLDLTGIETVERPELRHLVTQSARRIENALTLRQPHSLLLRLNWPGQALGDESDALVCLDGDGWVTGANRSARQMVAGLPSGDATPVHASDLFALPVETLFDASRRADPTLEVPLWSDLRLQVLARPAGSAAASAPVTRQAHLRDVEIALIRKAVADARGNVQQAARALGISRATVYRKLGQRPQAS